MAERPSPFCPLDCKFVGVPIVCDTDCYHSKDIKLYGKKEVEVKTGKGWEKAIILGKNEEYYYISINGLRSQIGINSPNLRC